MKLFSKNILRPILLYVAPALLGVWLMYMAFLNIDFSEVWGELSQIDTTWVWAILAITVVCHWARAARWSLLLKASGQDVPVFASFIALMGGYLINYAVPRLGEAFRCAAVYKTHRANVQATVGTVVVERVVDVLCLLAVMLLALWSEWTVLQGFVLETVWPPLLDKFQSVVRFWWAVGIAAVIFFLFMGLIFWFFGKKIREKLHLFHSFWNGLKSVANLPSPWLFVGYTATIWLCYYAMTYLWFFTLAGTSGLGLKAGLGLMLIGSLVRTIPIQAGSAGAYHYLFSQGAMAYGVSQTAGLSLAILIHGFQSVYYILVGPLCLLAIGWIKRTGSDQASQNILR